LGEAPRLCAAVEDSASGIRSAAAAGLHVVAIPNPHYPPPAAILAEAAALVESVRELTPEVFEEVGRARQQHVDERLDEMEIESFPASDSHSDWAGPPG
jgi:beta-phosphoglucomutase-like phosphatase (HAD superfamily)